MLLPVRIVKTSGMSTYYTIYQLFSPNKGLTIGIGCLYAAHRPLLARTSSNSRLICSSQRDSLTPSEDLLGSSKLIYKIIPTILSACAFNIDSPRSLPGSGAVLCLYVLLFRLLRPIELLRDYNEVEAYPLDG
jgi:hypothetical protein